MKRIMATACMLGAIASHATAAPEVFPPHNWLTPPEIPGSSPNRIAYINGNKLLEYCETDSFACSLYISGVVDGQFAVIVATSRTVAYCIPEGSTSRQVMDVVIKYLREHPEERNQLGGALVARALSSVWPQCQ